MGEKNQKWMRERQRERETEPKNGLFLIKHDEQFSSSLPTKNYLTSVLFVFFSLNPHRFRFGVAFVWFSCGGVGGEAQGEETSTMRRHESTTTSTTTAAAASSSSSAAAASSSAAVEHKTDSVATGGNQSEKETPYGRTKKKKANQTKTKNNNNKPGTKKNRKNEHKNAANDHRTSTSRSRWWWRWWLWWRWWSSWWT